MKLLAFVLLATLIVILGILFRESLTLEKLSEQEQQLRSFQEFNPFLIYGMAFLIYVIVAGLALPGAAALSLVYAWFFGFWPAVILISFASTLGGTISFLLSRYLLRDAIIDRFGPRLAVFNENLRRDGAFYLFTLRLIPAVPFFIINLVMGLTPIKTWTFWWVSQLGMLPGTAVYVYAGSSVPGLTELAEKGVRGIFNWQIVLAFVLLGTFPIIVSKISVWLKSRTRTT